MYMFKLFRGVFFIEPRRGLGLPLENKSMAVTGGIRTALRVVETKRRLCRVYAAAALTLATTLERFHLAISLDEHRLCVRPPTNTNTDTDAHAHAHAHAHSRAYATNIRRHAPDGTRRWYALSLPLAEHEDSRLVGLAQRVLSSGLCL